MSTCASDDALSKFWELENIPNQRHLTREEKDCEKHYNDTTEQNDDGRFVVQLPFKQTGSRLGLSKAHAMKRFLNLERKLLADPDLRQQYSNFIKEFIDLGHLEQVPPNELETNDCFYLPHHCVRKADSTTTKL